MPRTEHAAVLRRARRTKGSLVRVPPREARTLTPGQVQAIRTVMQLFVEEDLAAGPPRTRSRWCAGCGAPRPGAGFISYECADLCHPCATAYELARARGTVQTAGEFLTVRRATKHAAHLARHAGSPEAGRY